MAISRAQKLGLIARAYLSASPTAWGDSGKGEFGQCVFGIVMQTAEKLGLAFPEHRSAEPYPIVTRAAVFLRLLSSENRGRRMYAARCVIANNDSHEFDAAWKDMAWAAGLSWAEVESEVARLSRPGAGEVVERFLSSLTPQRGRAQLVGAGA